MIYIFLIMIMIHYVADFPLQGEFLGKHKGDSHYLMFVHCFIWTGIVSLGLYYFDLYSLWKLIFLFVIHFAADTWKSKHPILKTPKYEFIDEKYKILYKDQIIHLIQIGVVVFL